MQNNLEDGLYYFDVQLISDAANNTYNIADDTYLTVAGHTSEGFALSNTNSTLSFSSGEEVKMTISPKMLDIGDEDSLVGRTLLPGNTLRVTYDYSATVADAQTTLLSDSERVINNNPLARHFFPAYVRFSFTYSGGSAASVVKEDIIDYINKLPANTALEAYDLQVLARNRGANYVQEPLTMIAVTHQKDRTIIGNRSKNRITLNRNEHFIAEADRVVDGTTVQYITVTRS